MNEEQHKVLKQRLEDGTAEALLKKLNLTDEQVEQCLDICKKTIKNYQKKNEEKMKNE